MLFNVGRQNKDSKSTTPQFRIYLAKMADVNVEGWPDPQDATITGTVLKANKKWTYLDSDVKSINPNAAPGESPGNGVLTLTPVIEGISKKSLQFIYDNAGERMICVWVRCSDNQKFIGGNPCSDGLQLTYTNIGKLENGNAGIALQLQGNECPEPFYFYSGTIEVEADPV